jgi:hypothetical protein
MWYCPINRSTTLYLVSTLQRKMAGQGLVQGSHKYELPKPRMDTVQLQPTLVTVVSTSK